MQIRKFIPNIDYEVVQMWWNAHPKWQPLPLEALPANGFIISDANAPIACCWVYKTDSAIAWVEWLISDPQTDSVARSEALDKLLKYCRDYAILDLGAKYIFSTISYPGLVERYNKLGFITTDTNMTNVLYNANIKE